MWYRDPVGDEGLRRWLTVVLTGDLE